VAKEPSKKTEATKPADKSAPAKTSKAASVKPAKNKDKQKREMPKFLQMITAPFRAFGRYVAGSWKELRQVFWPTRRATWGLTLAVILFTLFFTVLIIGLDTAFQELFKRILL
jgi:preprotein translocase SecE subunit